MTVLDTPDYGSSSQAAGANYLLVNAGATVGAGLNFTTPVVYAGAFESISVQIENNTPVLDSWFVTWYQDAAGTIPTFVETTYFGGAVTNVLMPFSVKAPYMTVRVINNSAGSGTFAVFVRAALSAASPGDVFPPFVIADNTGPNVPANSSIAVVPSFQICGPATLFGQAGGSNSYVRIERWNGSAWVNSGGLFMPNGAPGTVGVLITGDDTRLLLANQGAGAQPIAYSLIHGG